jgi:hypothetical protein
MPEAVAAGNPRWLTLRGSARSGAQYLPRDREQEGEVAVLFLDPLVVAVLLGLAVYVVLVWRGSYRAWFGRPEPWTVVAWPGPVLLVAIPLLGATSLWALEVVGLHDGDGGIGDAATYSAAYLLPGAGFALWPPAWTLPRWARRRLTPLPERPGPEVPGDAIPAVQGRRGHGSLARWVWRVDGVPGAAWTAPGRLSFRAASPGGGLEADHVLDDEAISELRFSAAGELRLEPPRGGWWGRGHLEVELGEVDRVRVRGVVPWRRDGRVTIEVDGRRPVHLWVGDVRELADRLSRTTGTPVGRRPRRRPRGDAAPRLGAP